MSSVSQPATPRARDVIEDFAVDGRGHFTSAEFRSELGVSDAAARQALSRLAAKGLIASPARGFYVIVPPGYKRVGCLPGDHFISDLMELRGIPYYVGLLSAAEHHGATHQRPQELQVVLKKNRPKIVCGGVRVVFVARRNFNAVPTETYNNPYSTTLVSTVEATAIDLVGYVNRSGGLDNVVTVLTELSELIVPRKLVAASKSAPILWSQRLGYLLEQVGAGDKARLLKKHVRRHARNLTKLMPSNDVEGAHQSDDWKLWVNARMEAEV